MAKQNFTAQVYDHFRVDSGSNSSEKELGKRYYVVTCGDSNGFGFYEKGVHKMVASNFSIEVVGSNSKKGPNEPDVFCPAKLIEAINGDIYLHAMSGDLILQGNNVYIRADGDSNEDGKVEILANNNIAVEGKDVTMLGTTNVRVASYGDAVFGGKISTNINGGLSSFSENSQFSFLESIITGDIFSPSKFLDTFKNLLNPDIF